VSPQLGLLKSTLLQLDSSFSERDYGASTFRDFAEKLEQRGFVTLKHSGRTTIVELSDLAVPGDAGVVPALPAGGDGASAESDAPTDADAGAAPLRPMSASTEPPLSLADGVALVRAVLAESTTPPRWPMYLRQMKQFIRAARPDFDERRYGSLPDLLRACQKDGLLRLERDRQGGLRAFAGSYRPSNVPHGWGTLAGPDSGLPQEDVDADVTQPPSAPNEAEPESAAPVEETLPLAAAEEQVVVPPRPIGDEPDDDQLAMFGVVAPDDPEPVAKRGRRKAAAAGGDGDRPRRSRKTAGAKEGGARARGGPRSRGEDTRPRGRGRPRS
jgi:hypothetical protein